MSGQIKSFWRWKYRRNLKDEIGSWSDEETNDAEHTTTAKSLTYKWWALRPKKGENQAPNMLWMK